MQTPTLYSSRFLCSSGLVVFLLSNIAASITFAVDRTFDAGADVFGDPGPNPTSWGALENWSPDGVPTDEDAVSFNNQFYPMLPNVHLNGASRIADSLNLSFQPTQGEWRLGADGGGFETRAQDGAVGSATLTLTSGIISRNGTNNHMVHIIGATSGSGLLAGAVMTLATDASGFTFDLGFDGEVRIEAIISGADKTLTKSFAGLLTITRASTFTGATMINSDFDGLNTLNAAVDGALGNTSSISVESGGTLMLSNATAFDRIRNDAPIRLGGPTYTGISTLPSAIRRAGGGNEGLGDTIGLGALTLTALNSIIDYGGAAAGNGTLTFADFAAGDDSIISIRGYNGVFGTAAPGIDGTDDRLIFVTSQTDNLLRFEFINPSGMSGTFRAAQITLGSGFFEIVPVGSPVSSFQISELRREGNDIVIVFPAIAGQRYRVKASENLTDGFPLVIATVPPAPDNVMREVTDTNGALEPRRFYLVMEIGPTD